VHLLFTIIAASLGILFLWGLIAPRGLWTVLIGWSYRDPYRHQPSGAVFVLYRLIAAFGLASMILTTVIVWVQQSDADAHPPASSSSTEGSWGSPRPQVVDRVVVPLASPPVGLVDQPILGYQRMDGFRRQPPYLFDLPDFASRGAVDANGYVGRDPSTGLTALDSANLVVHVVGDVRCFPHDVVVVEEAKVVRIGVFYGQANPSDGTNAANLAACDVEPRAANAVSVLVPVRLAAPLGDRELLSLDGTSLREVHAPPAG
jgi:hypothetical protein